MSDEMQFPYVVRFRDEWDQWRERCADFAVVIRDYAKRHEEYIEALDAAKSAFAALEKGDNSECAGAANMVDDSLATAFEYADEIKSALADYDALKEKSGG